MGFSGGAAAAEGAKGAGEAVAADAAAGAAVDVGAGAAVDAGVGAAAAGAVDAGVAGAAADAGAGVATDAAAGAAADATANAAADSAFSPINQVAPNLWETAGQYVGKTILQAGIQTLMSSLAKPTQAVQAPALPAPNATPVMPTQDSAAVAKAQQDSVIAQMARGGRASTILTDQGGSNKLGG